VQSGLVGLDDQQVVGVLVGDQPVGVLTLGVLRIRGPLADRGQRPGAGQHCAHRHGQHRAQRMPPAASPSRIGELGEVGEQAAALVADQRGGRDRMGGRRDGR
jgi:hypothetical protein